MNEKLGQEPAFPELNSEYDGQDRILPYQNSGMSKRFYAACTAMQGLVTSIPLDNTAIWKQEIIEKSYKLADELLKQENE